MWETENNVNRIATIDDYHKGTAHRFLESEVRAKNYLIFENLTVTASPSSLIERLRKSNDHKDTIILHPMSGFFPSNSIYALMGSSGSGKTTLLNSLCGYNQKNMTTSGLITYNNKTEDIMKISAYIQQIDLFCPRITVKEHLKFQIRLQVSNSTDHEERKKILKWLIVNFSLEKCSNNTIGDGFKIKGISGGEKKRLSVASEIIKKPKIVFADEPTSGLDSYMAESVIKSLKKLSELGAIVICTIHQPSSVVFKYFDGVCLLSAGHLLIRERTQNVFIILKKAGFKCPISHNPADFLIYSTTILPNSEEESRKRNHTIEEIGKKMFPYKRPTTNENQKKITEKKSRYKATTSDQLGQLLWREMLVNRRQGTVMYSKLAINILMGLLCGSLYYNTPFSVSKIANIMGAMFIISVILSFQNLFGVLNVFPQELNLFNRERKNLLYSPTIYFISKLIQEIPMAVITTTMFTVIAYLMIGLKITAGAFFFFLFVCILVTECSISFAYLISTLCGEVKLSSVIAAPFAILLLLFGGFVIRQSDTPIYYIWISYFSWFKYAFELFTITQLNNTKIACDDLNFNACKYNKTIEKQFVFDQFGMSEENYYKDLIGLLVLTLGYRLLAYIILLIKYNSRHRN